MRYYSIVIINPATGQVVVPVSLAALGSKATYTNYVNGQILPGGLGIELDVPVAPFATPAGAGYVKVCGVSLSEIFQGNDLEGMLIDVYAGMQLGLPLAKPAQAGLIVHGVISQAFGNWIDLEQSLDLIVVADAGTSTAPKNLILNWRKGATLASALATTFKAAFPNASVDINISPKLVSTSDEVGYYASVTQLATFVLSASKSLLKDQNYPGVGIAGSQSSFKIYDGTVKPATKAIAFEDMIGQPTWIGPATVQFKTTMRADLTIDDVVTFPPAVTTATAGGTAPFGSGLKQKSTFQGTFSIIDVHHFGNSRQPDGYAWNTTYNVVPAA